MGLAADIKRLVQHSRIISSTTTANWNSGVATSGQPGADLFAYGRANQWWRMDEAFLVLSDFNMAPGVDVNIRAYLNIAGAERAIMDDDWTPLTDGELGYIIWFWDVQIFGPLRVEVHSGAAGAWPAGDDGLVAHYE
ncbi:MAG: hypothetical protein V2A77_09680, partial [Pseudomonadota bacterium]